MNKSAIEHLKEQKIALKLELLELEGKMPFSNASNTFGFIKKGISRFVSPKNEFPHPFNTHKNTNIAGLLTDVGIRLGSNLLINKLVKSNLRNISLKKRIFANVALYTLPLVLNKLIEIIEKKQEKQTEN